MHLNDVLVADASNLYHHRSLLETVLSFGTEARKSQPTMGLYYKDTPGHMNAINDSNTGLKARKSFTNGGNFVPMIGRIHSDMFFQNRYLLNGVDIRLKLLRNPDSLVLMAADGSTFKLKIVNISFLLEK